MTWLLINVPDLSSTATTRVFSSPSAYVEVIAQTSIGVALSDETSDMKYVVEDVPDITVDMVTDTSVTSSRVTTPVPSSPSISDTTHVSLTALIYVNSSTVSTPAPSRPSGITSIEPSISGNSSTANTKSSNPVIAGTLCTVASPIFLSKLISSTVSIVNTPVSSTASISATSLTDTTLMISSPSVSCTTYTVTIPLSLCASISSSSSTVTTPMCSSASIPSTYEMSTTSKGSGINKTKPYNTRHLVIAEKDGDKQSTPLRTKLMEKRTERNRKGLTQTKKTKQGEICPKCKNEVKRKGVM